MVAHSLEQATSHASAMARPSRPEGRSRSAFAAAASSPQTHPPSHCVYLLVKLGLQSHEYVPLYTHPHELPSCLA